MSSSATSTTPRMFVGAILVLTASLGFASKGIFIKLSYNLGMQIDAITIMALRMLMALPLFLATAFMLRTREDAAALTTGDYLRILYLGFLGYYLSSYLDLSGLYYISAGMERLILYLYPTFVIVLSAVILRKPISRQELSALALSYAGIAGVFFLDLRAEGDAVIRGGLLVMLAALSFAIFMIGSHEAIHRIGSARFTAYSMSVATLLTLIHYLLNHGVENLVQPFPFYLYGVCLAIAGTVLPAFLMNAGLQRIGANRTSILTSIGPVMTLGLAYLYLGEGITLPQAAGTLLILAGVYLASRPQTPA